MKPVRMSVLLALVALAATSPTASAGQAQKGMSHGRGCCAQESIAMIDMQDHNQHKQEQIKKDTTVKKLDQKTKAEYVCPMHPGVKSSSPGTCPKCKMDLVEVKKDKKSLMKEKRQAMKDGKYSCCLKESCDECLKAHGSCDCRKAVKNGKSVCNECYEGWQRGEGDVSGKTAKDIKKGHQH